MGLAFGYGDGFDGVAGLGVCAWVAHTQGEHDVEAGLIGDFAEDGVFVVEVRCWAMGDEELGAVGAGSGVCHREDAGRVVPEVGVKFVVEAVAGAARARASGVAALGHEVGDDAVEGGVVVEAFAGEEDEVVDGVGGIVGE